MHTLTVTALTDAHDTSDNREEVVVTENFVLWPLAVAHYGKALAQYGEFADGCSTGGSADGRYMRADFYYPRGADVVIELRRS